MRNIDVGTSEKAKGKIGILKISFGNYKNRIDKLLGSNKTRKFRPKEVGVAGHHHGPSPPINEIFPCAN